MDGEEHRQVAQAYIKYGRNPQDEMQLLKAKDKAREDRIKREHDQKLRNQALEKQKNKKWHFVITGGVLLKYRGIMKKVSSNF